MSGIVGIMNYLKKSLTGAVKLAQFDKSGMDYFDVSADGFWNSFWAIAVAAPIVLIPLYTGHLAAEDAGLQSTLWLRVVLYLIELPLTAVLMIFYTRYLGISANYATMIIANNWCSVIAYIFQVLMNVGLSFGQTQSAFASAAWVAIMVYLFAYQWFLIKVSLKVGGWMAFGTTLFQQLSVGVFFLFLVKWFGPDLSEQLAALVPYSG